MSQKESMGTKAKASLKLFKAPILAKSGSLSKSHHRTKNLAHDVRESAKFSAVASTG